MLPYYQKMRQPRQSPHQWKYYNIYAKILTFKCGLFDSSNACTMQTKQTSSEQCTWSKHHFTQTALYKEQFNNIMYISKGTYVTYTTIHDGYLNIAMQR